MEITLDLNEICRTCMCVSDRTLSVFMKDLKFNIAFSVMITELSEMKFTANDGLSEKLCYSCAQLLRKAYGFQQMCNQSYNTLTSYVKHREPSEEVPIEVTPAEERLEVNLNEESVESQPQLNDETGNLVAPDWSPTYDDYENYLKNEEYLEDSYASDADKSGLADVDNHQTADEEQTLSCAIEIKSETLNEDVKLVDECSRGNDNEASVGNINNGESNLECKVCLRVLSSISHLKRHMKIHTQSKPFQCSECLRCFCRKDNLLAHIKLHSSERPCVCQFCSASFRRFENLKKHMYKHHKDRMGTNKLFPCTICDKILASAKNLNTHLEAHTQIKSFTCHHCAKEFTNRSAYTIHMRNHSLAEKKPFLCPKCGKCFRRKDYLQVHLRRHTGEKPFKCQYCDKAFPRATDLNIHVKYHKNEKVHTCVVCGKSFHRQYNLTVHSRLHTGEKPYQCPHCPKQFNQSYDLIVHIRRHTGERFKCDVCDSAFLHVSQLNQHLRDIHNRPIHLQTRRVTKIVHLTKQDGPQETSATSIETVDDGKT
ncbi:zinc finger protein OZF-like [Anopheles bellator]|uniref:zinc finger protein OZF-like n=1 Tax=Anopheles bellator TaxID=139047 RepID=UPI0026475AC1|nr:zinc finger protein OZF-like [Anopheles bellator]